ncbi:MFS transporter [Fertoebacter nigrum]|uniref:MFS transporter n=1 Tax=Fertoeibacter niger TaxID=2656921 RepID=A0A8X8KPT2_9RHOB|nr:MFS transporter [Fertoeibacter niger]NUB45450.1 MFS transporter [Fertoeibacter niger]
MSSEDIVALPRLAPSRRGVIWAASACAVMSGAAIAPAIPGIEQALSGGGGTVWGRIALVVPALVIMCAGPWIGRQTGRMDQRSGFVAALCAMAAFGVAGGLATGFGWLLLTRVGLGLATAATLCFATAAIAALFQGEERGHVISRQAAINTFGGVVFVLLGGLMSQFGWQVPFLLYLLTLPVAFFAAGFDWRAPVAQAAAKPEMAGLWVPLATLALAMMAFYLVPVQAPFVPVLVQTPALSGLVIACATLASGLVSLRIAAVLALANGPVVQAAAIFAVILGLVEFGLAASLPQLVLAAGLIGAGFGALLPMTVRRIMAGATPATSHAIAGLIASALYAGQVGASLLAVVLSLGGPRLPFFAIAAGLGLACFLQANRARLRPWARWIWEHLA